MTNPQDPLREPSPKHPGFFSIIPILARLLWSYGRKLFSVETLVALEKKQGAGSGERTVEEDLLEQALQRNKHHYHFDQYGPASPCSTSGARLRTAQPSSLGQKGG